MLVAEGQEEEEDADDSGDQDEQTGEQSPIGRVAVDVDDQLVPAPQLVAAAFLLVLSVTAGTTTPTGTQSTFSHVLPHDEPNADCTLFQQSKAN